MLQYLTGGAWGPIIRRFLKPQLESAGSAILLFRCWPDGQHLPVVHPELIQNAEVREIIEHKHAYLNVPFLLAALHSSLLSGSE
jgi:hypothetical protein